MNEIFKKNVAKFHIILYNISALPDGAEPGFPPPARPNPQRKTEVPVP